MGTQFVCRINSDVYVLVDLILNAELGNSNPSFSGICKTIMSNKYQCYSESISFSRKVNISYPACSI